MIKIVTDSTCNLQPELVQKHDLRLAPISIQFGEETYEEDLTIDRTTFYRKIEEMGIIPTTSQPTPAWFERFYREHTVKGHSILAITITSAHSGTYQSAVLAKELVPEADVEVFDSRSISLGTGWMVLEAARMAEAGRDRASILARLEHIRDRSVLFLTPATLRYLQMSGRVGKLQGALASLLNVKPIIALKEGVLEAGENIRTRGKALDRLVELLGESLGTTAPVNLGVIHARAFEEAEGLLQKARSRLNCQQVLMEDLVASLAVHGGPGVVGLFAYPV